MAKLEEWSAPRSDAVLATYRVAAGKLKPCKGQDSRPHTRRARSTLTLWTAAQAFPETSMMVIKADDTMSLGIRNGGIIVEGRNNLNVGMFRATTRNLQPITAEHHQAIQYKSADRFRRTFQMIVERLEGAVIPRAFQFAIGIANGTIHAKDGKLWFDGDFQSPSDFVQELRAACEVDDDVKYTLLADFDAPDTTAYHVKDLIAQVATPTDTGKFTFDESGWPLEWDKHATPETVQKLSVLAIAAGQLVHTARPLAVSLLSEKNESLVSMTICKDNQIEVHLR